MSDIFPFVASDTLIEEQRKPSFGACEEILDEIILPEIICLI